MFEIARAKYAQMWITQMITFSSYVYIILQHLIHKMYSKYKK
jgi:hypothetical protein